MAFLLPQGSWKGVEYSCHNPWLGDRGGDASFSRSADAGGGDTVSAGGEVTVGVSQQEVVGVEGAEAAVEEEGAVISSSVVKGRRGSGPELLGLETAIVAGNRESAFSTRSISPQSS